MPQGSARYEQVAHQIRHRQVELAARLRRLAGSRITRSAKIDLVPSQRRSLVAAQAGEQK